MADNVCGSRHLSMKVRRTQFHRQLPRRSFVAVALLIICALVTHSLDNCAAHLGGLANPANNAQQIKAPCSNAASGPCQLCAPTDKPHSDSCDLLAEIAVLTPSSQHQIEHQAITLAATVAVVPAMPQVIALSGCLHGRAVPPPAAPLSVFLRSSLPSRAPPLSA